MKHCVCFSIVLLVLSCMVTSCVKHDEIEFSGTVIDVRSCSSLNLSMDQNPAYLIALDYPASIGGDYYGDTNVVALYEPTRHIMGDDHVHGTFYLDDKYSKTTCEWHNTDYDLPEGVFTETIVD